MNTIPFSGYGLDRAGVRRTDGDWLAARLADPDTDLVLLDRGRPVLALPPGERGGRAPLRLTIAARGELLDPAAPLLFLGVDGEGRAVFAGEVRRGVELDVGPLQGLGEAMDLRAAAAGPLQGPDLALMGTAKALFDWHARHGFCSACGHRSDVVEGGWKRVCPSCGTEHFPRTDPVAIMLAVRDSLCFLGSSHRFPAGYVSCLAGFIEPGESAEEGCARELMEEAGLRALSSRIVSNQPWPFPSQLMIGLIAEVAPGDVRLDPAELKDGRWFTRDEARALLEPDGLEKDGLVWRAPPPLAIAHHIISAWIEGAD